MGKRHKKRHRKPGARVRRTPRPASEPPVGSPGSGYRLAQSGKAYPVREPKTRRERLREAILPLARYDLNQPHGSAQPAPADYGVWFYVGPQLPDMDPAPLTLGEFLTLRDLALEEM